MMPVQINELVVKGNVDQEKGKKEDKKANSKSKEDGMSKLSYSLRKQIVDQCTEEVLAKLRNMSEF